MTTITITGPKLQAAIVNGRVQITPASPPQQVTRTITADDVTVAAFVQRIANLTGYQPQIDDTTNPGNLIANPIDCVMPSLVATAQYWGAEAQAEAETIAELASAAAYNAALAAALGAGVTGIT